MNRILVTAFALGFSASAFAATETATLTVQATVSDSCTISTAALDFGAYDTVAGTQVDGTGTVTVACTTGATADVTLGQGANADALSTDAAPLRRMTDGTDFLAYELFSDSGRTTTWGNTVATGLSYAAASSATSDLTVFGRITASQDVQAGSYSDSVTATIEF